MLPSQKHSLIILILESGSNNVLCQDIYLFLLKMIAYNQTKIRIKYVTHHYTPEKQVLPTTAHKTEATF